MGHLRSLDSAFAQIFSTKIAEQGQRMSQPVVYHLCDVRLQVYRVVAATSSLAQMQGSERLLTLPALAGSDFFEQYEIT
jgi:hypothetical protein